MIMTTAMIGTQQYFHVFHDIYIYYNPNNGHDNNDVNSDTYNSTVTICSDHILEQ